MTQTALERHAVSEAFNDLVKRLGSLTEAVLDGKGSRHDADLVFLCAAQAANASREFNKLLSLSHADNMGVDPDDLFESPLGGTYRPHSPNETIEDFAEWAGSLAKEANSPPVNPYYDPWKEHALGARQLVSVGYRQAAE